MDQFGRLASARKDEGLRTGAERVGHQQHGVVGGAAPGQAVLSQWSRIPKREVLAAARRAVAIDDSDIVADESAGELTGVGDRCAGGEHDRLRSVMFADSL